MKISVRAGKTSLIIPVFIQDTSKADGSGLGGLVFNSAGLTMRVMRSNDAAPRTVSLVSGTLGTFVSAASPATAGFIQADATNMKGLYWLSIPNSALAAGATSVVVYLFGATNMAPVCIEINLSMEVTLTPEGFDQISNTKPTVTPANLAALTFRDRAWYAQQAILGIKVKDDTTGSSGNIALKDLNGSTTILTWAYTVNGLDETITSIAFA